ncbi:MAG: helix-turn-helix transcriptional regulator [Lachnospiraceae bacterium]|nr:helix-turn-helix transcriptional regulator [Lachnospiraceae bacterium]
MTFGEKLKTIRRHANMSQEKLAEKIGVSRQAITKWETDRGIPDIENIIAISKLFDISVDELISEQKSTNNQTDYLYESVTEYDIDHAKRYDMKLGGANKIMVSGYDGEKIRIRLASNTLSTIQSDFKLKIDDIKNCIDLDMNRLNQMTEASAKESLFIYVQLPQKYITRIELDAHAKSIELRSLNSDSIELDIKSSEIILEDVVGTVEINCNLDMNIVCNTLDGAVEINQLNSTSRIQVPQGIRFKAVRKGLGNSISYQKNDIKAECFADEDSENVIELNGIKSELVICTSDC